MSILNIQPNSTSLEVSSDLFCVQLLIDFNKPKSLVLPVWSEMLEYLQGLWCFCLFNHWNICNRNRNTLEVLSDQHWAIILSFDYLLCFEPCYYRDSKIKPSSLQIHLQILGSLRSNFHLNYYWFVPSVTLSISLCW